MSLQVLLEQDKDKQVFKNGLAVKWRLRCEVGIGEFGVAHNTKEATALGTASAVSCVIIVVHKQIGWGALGHYNAHSNPKLIVKGVEKMVQKLEGGPITDVVFAAGAIGANQEQFDYESCIMGDVRGLYPGARVIWAKTPAGGVLGACYYLPYAQQVGLHQHYPGSFCAPVDPELIKDSY